VRVGPKCLEKFIAAAGEFFSKVSSYVTQLSGSTVYGILMTEGTCRHQHGSKYLKLKESGFILRAQRQVT
jgi:hypothetical protein